MAASAEEWQTEIAARDQTAALRAGPEKKLSDFSQL
jgi:hypothetical protein